MIRPFKRWNGFCYLGVAAVGLAVDIALFLVGIKLGMLPVYAAAFAYSIAALTLGWLCSQAVFAHHSATLSQLRHRQKMMFLKASLFGLIVTMGTVLIGTTLGMTPLAAKALAIPLSFNLSFIFRRRMLLLA